MMNDTIVDKILTEKEFKNEKIIAFSRFIIITLFCFTSFFLKIIG